MPLPVAELVHPMHEQAQGATQDLAVRAFDCTAATESCCAASQKLQPCILLYIYCRYCTCKETSYSNGCARKCFQLRPAACLCCSTRRIHVATGGGLCMIRSSMLQVQSRWCDMCALAAALQMLYVIYATVAGGCLVVCEHGRYSHHDQCSCCLLPDVLQDCCWQLQLAVFQQGLPLKLRVEACNGLGCWQTQSAVCQQA
jgi:hypothetical protein